MRAKKILGATNSNIKYAKLCRTKREREQEEKIHKLNFQYYCR